ncbi:biotin transporter BioY [Clostridium sp. D2Q-14]|uniref:biotin transporter BioY n=1 Tax=Anaeromonas gelatinilytica TaxID=2683194 RepID=UPI00193C13F0|nr:biotin transporter BioY [Anaeromonas gelatinilytica]MBS4535741.1 biotin transporter BioY [Anaeromonas gelatinilytica]
MTTKNLTTVSIFVALTAICAQISIPLPSGIPVTLQTLAVLLSGIILGSKYGALSQLTYILLGAIGIPVFASGHAGVQALASLTGGYIWSFPISSFIIGLIGKHLDSKSKVKTGIIYSLAFIIGLIIIYTFGSIQFYFLSGMTYMDTLKITIIPFIIPDLIKIIIAVGLSIKLRKSLLKANLISF